MTQTHKRHCNSCNHSTEINSNRIITGHNKKSYSESHALVLLIWNHHVFSGIELEHQFERSKRSSDFVFTQNNHYFVIDSPLFSFFSITWRQRRTNLLLALTRARKGGIMPQTCTSVSMLPTLLLFEHDPRGLQLLLSVHESAFSYSNRVR